jgi:hypothetical protein
VLGEIDSFHGIVLFFPQWINPVAGAFGHHVVGTEELAEVDYHWEGPDFSEQSFWPTPVCFPVPQQRESSDLVVAKVAVHDAPDGQVRARCLFLTNVCEAQVIVW